MFFFLRICVRQFRAAISGFLHGSFFFAPSIGSGSGGSNSGKKSRPLCGSRFDLVCYECDRLDLNFTGAERGERSISLCISMSVSRAGVTIV